MGKKRFKNILIKLLLWVTDRKSTIVFVEFINNKEYVLKSISKLKEVPCLGSTVFLEGEKEYVVVRHIHKITIGHKIYVVLNPTNKIPTTEDK